MNCRQRIMAKNFPTHHTLYKKKYVLQYSSILRKIDYIAGI